MRKILFISHALSGSGAPLVLLDMLRYCRSCGDHVDLVSLDDGVLREELEAEGINVVIASDFLDNLTLWQKVFYKYDLVVVNTLVNIEAIYALNTTTVPTIWWIHEHEPWFIHYQPVLPKPEQLQPNIHVYGVSPVTNDLIRQYGGYEPNLLPFGVVDTAGDVQHRSEDSEGKIRFVLPATISSVKGQDILLEAIDSLPENVLSRCEFQLFGAESDGEHEFYQSICEKTESMPQVSLSGPVPREESLSRIADADYLVVPSRFEPFPTIAVEAMMLGKPCILSDVCGVNYFCDYPNDSMRFEEGNAVNLADMIIMAVDLYDHQHDEYEKMCLASRATYDKHFTMKVFEHNIEKLFSEIIA